MRRGFNLCGRNRMLDRLQSLADRYEEVTAQMGQPDVAADYERLQELAKERASLEDIVFLYWRFRETDVEIEDARNLLEEASDPEMESLAKDELEQLNEKKERLTQDIRRALLPPDRRDEKDVIVEVRAGTGGDEAGLFAADLFRMYSRYADNRGWGVEVLSSSESGIGGFKEIIFEVKGKGAYSRLKYESGVHRVQRVPQTEAQGRIHTSTATVAVLPEAEEVDVKISEDDLRVDIFHSSGHGGQNVQKVATAVRLTHIPTGIIVTCQDERSQWKNRVKAMAVLRARVFDMEQSKQAQEITETRRSQVGTGERAEKIRTYNFPQDRITDHRIGLNFHNLPGILAGEIDPLIDAVSTSEQARLLEEQLG